LSLEPMAAADLETRLRDSELSRLRAWEQLTRVRAVLEALCGRRLPAPERRDFEAEGDLLVGALYEEVAMLFEDLSRLEAFSGQLRPVIGQPLAGEEAEALRLSMLEHLSARPLRLGEVRLRLDRAWGSGALPPGVKRRGFPPGRRPGVHRVEGAAPPGAAEGPPGPPEFPFAGLRGEPPCKRPVKAPKTKSQAAGPAEPGLPQQATFAWD
jgi:hypothetical protein